MSAVLARTTRSTSFVQRTLPLLALAVVVIACIANRWSWYAAETALRGYSPVGWVYAHEHPADFAQNWPTGTENYNRSAVMWIYLLAYRYFGLEADTLVYAIIALEIIGLAWCYLRMSHTLLDDPPVSLAVVIAMLAVASSARNISLSCFATPFFEGQFYTFAEIARNMALLAALRGRWNRTAAWLSVATVNHLIIGALGGAFVAAVAALRWRHGERAAITRAALVLLVISAAWVACFYEPRALYVDPVPDAVWFSWTRFFNYHWYPWAKGVFLEDHDRWLLPFTTLLAAAAMTWAHPATRPRRWSREIALGMAVMAGLTVLAVVASEQTWSTTLVKLALHRGADVMLSLALVYAVALWWFAITTLPLWRAIPAAFMLFAPTWSPGSAGVPLALHGMLARPDGQRRRSPVWWSLALLPLTMILLYRCNGRGADWMSAAYSGLGPVLKQPGTATPLLLVLLLLWGARRRRDIRMLGVVVTVAASCLAWVGRDVPGGTIVAEGADYLEAQLWARAHTPTEALFFVDPTISYGWSDYSRRSSFGNVRDWLHNWAYNSRREWWQRGVERLALLGLSMDSYLPLKQGPRLLNRDAQTRFYRADDDWRRKLRTDWGVDYFVMRRAPANNSHLPVVFQNKKFMVLMVDPP